MRVIAGSARGRRLKARKGKITRPTADRVKESVFNILSPRLGGCSFLDIFAGNGGVGIEALSRGAGRCVFIEKNSHCAAIIKENLAMTGLSGKARVMQRDFGPALSELAGEKEIFDIIFMDPPYHSEELPEAVRQVALLSLLAPGGLLAVEHHLRHNDWVCSDWRVVREKEYGDTAVTFLTLSGNSV